MHPSSSCSEKISYYKVWSLHRREHALTRTAADTGFTLVELIVVVFILSLMAALAMPSFSVTGESRIKSDAKKISAILRYLSDSALSRKETYPLKIDFADHMIVYESPEGQRSESFPDLAAVDMQTKGLISEGQLVIFFGPLGASEAFSVVLEDSGDYFTVAFNPLSGRVKLSKSSE